MSGKSVFLYHPAMEQYCFRPDHPFDPARLKATVSLLKAMNLLDEKDILIPGSAAREDLLLAHTAGYLDRVEKLSAEGAVAEAGFGLGTEDTPLFPGMHDAASLIAGSTMQAVAEVLEGRADHAVSISGGLHHAQRNQASGFCIYNDINVAIRFAQKRYGARILYLDTDAHHGDGVQWEFYDDPDVLTISFHENGRYLFPGTGWINENGKGAGIGYSVNIPLEPFTEDESFLECFHEVLPPLVEAFAPDLIFSQNGCDGHCYDPLTHFQLSMASFKEIPRLVHQLAHTYTMGKWVAVGGGGYDPYRVVPRAWTLLWAEAAHLTAGETIPQEWIDQWQTLASHPLSYTLMDPAGAWASNPRRAEIAEKNLVSVQRALQDSFISMSKFL